MLPGKDKVVVWDAGNDWSGNIAELRFTVEHSTTPELSADDEAQVDSRDYSLTVVSAKGGLPATGLHTYPWGSSVTCSVGNRVATNRMYWLNMGWTGTGSIPESGDSNSTGEIELTYLESSIEWLWLAEFSYSIRANNTVTITGYGGLGGHVAIPDQIEGMPVTRIDAWAFLGCDEITSISIRESVTTIGEGAFFGCGGLQNVTVPKNVIAVGNWAFGDCASLVSVYFEGNAPLSGEDAFFNNDDVTIHYNPETSGWGDIWAGMPTSPMEPPIPLHIVTSNAEFGMRHDGFSLPISGQTGIQVIVEAASDLGLGDWTPVETNLLHDGTWMFHDSNATNLPHRFYRVREE